MDLILNKSNSLNGMYDFHFCSQRQEIIIAYGSDKQTHCSLKSRKYSYDQIIKTNANLCSKKGEYKDNYFPHLTRLQTSLLMSIVDTPEEFIQY